ncbi:MAG: hypothetical protein RID42_11660 [Alphaproteobacteria bacterium]
MFPHKLNGRRWLTGAVAVGAVIVAGSAFALWSWNTLAVDLFDAPRIAYRHAVAVVMSVLFVKWLLFPGNRGRFRHMSKEVAE